MIGPPTIFAAAHPIISDKINKNGNMLLRAIFSLYYLQVEKFAQIYFPSHSLPVFNIRCPYRYHLMVIIKSSPSSHNSLKSVLGTFAVLRTFVQNVLCVSFALKSAFSCYWHGHSLHISLRLKLGLNGNFSFLEFFNKDQVCRSKIKLR